MMNSKNHTSNNTQRKLQRFTTTEHKDRSRSQHMIRLRIFFFFLFS